MKLGKIKRITDLLSIWPHEANDKRLLSMALNL